MTAPRTTGQGTTGPGTTGPGTTAPGTTAPGTTAPGTTAPGTTAPGTTAPEDGAAEVIADLVRAHSGLGLPVRLRLWDGSEAGPAGTPVLIARSPRALRRILWRPGELGLARAYVSGDLDVDGDLTEALRRVRSSTSDKAPEARKAPGGGTAPGHAPPPGPIARLLPTASLPGPKTGLAAVRAVARLRVPVWPPPPPPSCELRVHGRLHSRARDRAVIAGHYDLPAAFYQLILDPSMAYSCALWDRADTLAGAQADKLDLICHKLDLGPQSRLLDVGCGWGSLTVHAAREHRAQVTAVTLSAEQGGYVRQRVRGLGLGGRAEVKIQDYRDVLDTGFDAIASVEMGEHVGAAQYPAFCAALHRRLRPGGRLLIQQMSRRGRAPGGGPFIESYIAPDMHMRPVGETVRLIEQAGFEVTGVQAMREHYVRTIRAWLDNFEASLPAVADLLTPEQIRVWRLYLAGGALAFEEGRMGVDQILAVRKAR
jgi:cyclopropane-fatty-acyl-phospholipid synthase